MVYQQLLDRAMLCPGWDSNPHTCYSTGPSNQRVYLFRHLDNLKRFGRVATGNIGTLRRKSTLLHPDSRTRENPNRFHCTIPKSSECYNMNPFNFVVLTVFPQYSISSTFLNPNLMNIIAISQFVVAT